MLKTYNKIFGKMNFIKTFKFLSYHTSIFKTTGNNLLVKLISEYNNYLSNH